MVKKVTFLWIAGITLTLLSGCGYHVGKLGHPQIKTIAIPPVQNESMAYNASAEMRTLLSEQFMLDGTYKVKSISKADCQLHVRILEVTFQEVTERSFDEEDEIFVADEWQATVTAEFSVVLPGRKEPLLKPRRVSGSANFQAPGDMDPNRRRGIRQACREAAIKIVEYTTEAW